MNKTISIIVPVYNAEPFLYRCIDSIIEQTYKELEIILVDDGSFDGSEITIDEYAKRDERIVCIHQHNQGESAARNAGLKVSTGQYVAFVDCDDWLDTDMYEILMGKAVKYDADIVAGSWYREYPQEDGAYESLAIINKDKVTNECMDTDELLRYLYIRDRYQGFSYMWNKLYKRKVVTNDFGELVMFDERLSLGGDVLYLGLAAIKCKKAVYVDRPFYHYRYRSQSGMHNLNTKKYLDWLNAYEQLYEALIRYGASQSILGYVKRFMAYHASNAAENAYKRGDIEGLGIFKSYMKCFQNDYENYNSEYPERITRYLQILNY